MIDPAQANQAAANAVAAYATAYGDAAAAQLAAAYGIPTAYTAQPVYVGDRASGEALIDELDTLVRDIGVETGGGATATPVAPAQQVVHNAGKEIWAGVNDPRKVHVTQVESSYNRGAAAGNRDCGPASVVMALRMLGKRIPGNAQQAIDKVRAMALNTSNPASVRGLATTDSDLERAIESVGAKWTETTDRGQIEQAIMSGKPVILNGNPSNAGAYGSAFSEKQMQPYDGPHWIAVTGYDRATGEFIINDPLSKVGPVKVTPEQLERYRGGSLGIVVSR